MIYSCNTLQLFSFDMPRGGNYLSIAKKPPMNLDAPRPLNRFFAALCLILIVVAFAVIYNATHDFAYSLFASLMVGLMALLVRLVLLLAFKKS